MRSARIQHPQPEMPPVCAAGSAARTTSPAAPVNHRLNLFQRMMLRWRSLHPYNAVHVVRIPAPLDLARLRASIVAQVESRGLTGLWVDRGGRRWRFDGGPADPHIEVFADLDTDTVTLTDTPSPRLAAAIEAELNRPFADAGHMDPLRFQVAHGVSYFHLCLVYDHFVASGDSIAGLLTDVALHYLGGTAQIGVPPPAHGAPTYRNVLLRHPSWALRALLGLPGMARRVRHASRPQGMDDADAGNALVMAHIGPAQLRAMVAAGKAWGVTINDLLLAGLMLALAPHAAARHRHPRRKQMAVASIVNVRKDFGSDADRSMSPCLAAFHVGHDVPHGIGLRELARDVNAITAPIRQQRLYLRSILALSLSALAWPALGPRQRSILYAKHFPAWGGVTSLNLNPIWADKAPAAIAQLDYFRVVPTGPLCPLVLAATTANDVMHLGIAYRRSAFERQHVAQLAEDLVRLLDPSQPQ